MTDPIATEHALALARCVDEPVPLDVDAEHRHADLNAHRCCFCPEFCATGDRLACSAHRRVLDETVMPWEGGES